MARSITVIPVKQISTAESGTAQAVQKLRMAAYCRVSTDQEEQLLSYENQVNYCTNYISENPLYEYAGTYADEGISGTNTKKRDEFNRMIADCRAGKIDMIITKSISRFARNTLDCLNYVRELKDLGIGIIFEKENINTMDQLCHRRRQIVNLRRIDMGIPDGYCDNLRHLGLQDVYKRQPFAAAPRSSEKPPSVKQTEVFSSSNSMLR